MHHVTALRGGCAIFTFPPPFSLSQSLTLVVHEIGRQQPQHFIRSLILFQPMMCQSCIYSSPTQPCSIHHAPIAYGQATPSFTLVSQSQQAQHQQTQQNIASAATTTPANQQQSHTGQQQIINEPSQVGKNTRCSKYYGYYFVPFSCHKRSCRYLTVLCYNNSNSNNNGGT